MNLRWALNTFGNLIIHHITAAEEIPKHIRCVLGVIYWLSLVICIQLNVGIKKIYIVTEMRQKHTKTPSLWRWRRLRCILLWDLSICIIRALKCVHIVANFPSNISLGKTDISFTHHKFNHTYENRLTYMTSYIYMQSRTKQRV